MNRPFSLIGLVILGFFFCSSSDIRGSVGVADSNNYESIDNAPVYGYKIVNSYPHDPEAFTQGLVYEHGFMYEGTGLHGRSSLRKVELETGRILQNHNLPNQYFGEGLTIHGDKITQLTWRSNVGFVYDKEKFSLVKKFNYATEGWGITYDGKNLVMSDGSNTLYFLDPITHREINRIKVTYDGRPVARLNELEYVNGEIFANVWLTDIIARISPERGKVIGWIDLRGLSDNFGARRRDQVLNGIAYDHKGDRLFVTGKLWPKIYEIKLERIN
ncbi:MAG: glutaminyl-peptide cyclotransferase [Thermodesulfobacteriota bacterium]